MAIERQRQLRSIPIFWRSIAIVRWKTLKSAELIWKDGNPTPTRSWTS
jgi:hypothetical protein